MASRDAGKQLGSFSLDPVTTDAVADLAPISLDIVVDKFFGKRPHGHLGGVDHSPNRDAALTNDCGANQPVR